MNTDADADDDGLFGILDPDAKVLAAVITLLGTLVGAAIAYSANRVSQGLKKFELTIREQSEARQARYSERQADREDRAERRLKIDTMLNALAQLGTPDGQEAASSQKTAALFALMELGHLDFALVLLESMLPADQVEPSAAITVIERAIGGPQEDQQCQAAALLENYSYRFVSDEGIFYWPRSVDGTWNEKLHADAKHSVLVALISVLAVRVPADWDIGYFISLYLTTRGMTEDSDKAIKAGAALVSKVLMSQISKRYNYVYLADGTRSDCSAETKRIDKKLSDIDQAVDPTGAVLAALDTLKRVWAQGERG
ncbi:MAG: hypothetical protein AAGB51_07050 [Planctomycetota bacterium]